MGVPGVAAGGGGWDLGVCGLGMRLPTQADGAMGCVGVMWLRLHRSAWFFSLKIQLLTKRKIEKNE